MKLSAALLALLAATTVVATAPTAGWAQFRVPTRADSMARADSIARDTVDETGRFLAAQGNIGVRVPILPTIGNTAPQPALSRIVFTRDSIEWTNAATVPDLLARVPGVYIWRGGWTGRAEMPNYQDRGATSVEYYVDGMPYVPVGVDSVSVDPSLLALSLFERIEVDRWPGLLRVRLYTRRHERLASRSRIAIARGDGDFARYQGSLEQRTRTGFGFGAAADYLKTDRVNNAQDGYHNTQAWVQGGYVPSQRFGVQYQLIRSRPDRGARLGAGGATDTIGAGFQATRTDAQLRLSASRRDDGMGARADLLYARTAWDGEGVDHQVNQIGGVLSYRTPLFSASGSVFHRTRWTSLDSRGTIAWTPTSHLTFDGEAVYQRHSEDRTSNWIAGRIGLGLPFGAVLSGSARVGSVVAAPSIDTDPAQDIKDFQASLGWQRRRIGFELSVARIDAFHALGYQAFTPIPNIGDIPRTTWFTASGRIAPLPWATLESWYTTPSPKTAFGSPPAHAITTGTIRSKFLRNFPSGAFDLKLQLGLERWSSGTLGFDTSGQPVTLPAATFMRSLIEIQISGFSIYWDRSNLGRTQLGYVPGYTIPGYASTFGLRWEFVN